jgi:hypothetical protein
MDPIRLRPHHLVNGVGKYLEWLNGLNGGKKAIDSERRLLESYYGHEFSDVQHQIMTSIASDPEIPIIIEGSWDDLCAPDLCMRRQVCIYDHECDKDIKKIEKLGLKIGQTTTSGYVTSKIRELWKIDERIKYTAQK